MDRALHSVLSGPNKPIHRADLSHPSQVACLEVHLCGVTTLPPRVGKVADMDSARNLLSNVPENLAEELAETLQAGAGLRIERIISLGHASPAGFWYDQDENEWVLLVSGAARLRFEGEEPMELKPGSYVHIPAHRRHRVEWTDPRQPSIWLAIHYQ